VCLKQEKSGFLKEEPDQWVSLGFFIGFLGFFWLLLGFLVCFFNYVGFYGKLLIFSFGTEFLTNEKTVNTRHIYG
jgi:hypothetical protein